MSLDARNMDKIADLIRNDPSFRQAFINITTKQDPSLGQQLTNDLRLLDNASGVASLTQEDKDAVERLVALGFDRRQALASYLASNKNETAAADALAKDSQTLVDPLTIQAPSVGQFINDNPQFKLALNEFIEQNDPDLAQQTKENPALFEVALNSESLGGDRDQVLGTIESILSLIDFETRVVEKLPLTTFTEKPTGTLPTYHVMVLPIPARSMISQFRRLIVEYHIQPTGTNANQTIFWTSYVIICRQGTLTRKTGVYTEWQEFGKVSSHPVLGIIAPRRNGIQIADISKGVLNGNKTHGSVLRIVDLEKMDKNVDIFVLLVAAPLWDATYQVHGQASLEFRI